MRGRACSTASDSGHPAERPAPALQLLSVANYRADGTPDPSSSLCGQTRLGASPRRAARSSRPSNVSSLSTGRRSARNIPAPCIRTSIARRRLAALQNAAVNAWIKVLNGYLNRQAAAQRAGVAFDQEAEEQLRRAAGGRHHARLWLALRDRRSRWLYQPPAGIVANNTDILGVDFSKAVLTKANAQLQADLKQFLTVTGPGYGVLTGTSMAAPNVSGFAAVLMGWFPIIIPG